MHNSRFLDHDIHRICVPTRLAISIFSTSYSKSLQESGASCKPLEGRIESNVRLSSIDSTLIEDYYIKEFPSQVFTKNFADRFEIYDFARRKLLYTPLSIQKRLLSYLSQPPPPEPYDCLSFVRDLLDGEFPINDVFENPGWDTRRFRSDANVSAGEVLLLARKESRKKLIHVAIKVTENLYLSKAGQNRPFLLLADPKTTQKLWDASSAFVLSLSSSAETIVTAAN